MFKKPPLQNDNNESNKYTMNLWGQSYIFLMLRAGLEKALKSIEAYVDWFIERNTFRHDFLALSPLPPNFGWVVSASPHWHTGHRFLSQLVPNVILLLADLAICQSRLAKFVF